MTYIGWILTIAGWFYSAYTANRREERKELKSEIDKCNTIAEGVINDLRCFHEFENKKQSELPSTSKIRYDLHRLMLKSERLSERLNASTIVEKSTAIWESVTKGSFDSKGFIDEAKTDLYMQTVEGLVHDFHEEMEEKLYTRFNKSNWASSENIITHFLSIKQFLKSSS